MSLPIIAIVGRANVGKSTLFNRLTEKQQALVSPIAGTTRDINYGLINWQGHYYQACDTGGLDIFQPQNTLEQGILRQAKKILAQAQAILFVVDAKSGVVPTDKIIAKEILRLHKPVILVANKADNKRLHIITKDYYSLGFGEPQFVSAANGSGTGDLLDLLQAKVPSSGEEPASSSAITLALLGKPNTGKSSLTNALLNEERVIVSEIPHATREAHYADFSYQGQDFTIVDTAGVRKKARITNQLEKISVKTSLQAALKAEVVLLITDVGQPLTTQDNHLTQEIADSGAGLIIIANKWDLAQRRDSEALKSLHAYYQDNFPYLAWAPILPISAKTGYNVKKILSLATTVAANRKKVLDQKELKDFLSGALKKNKPLKEAKRRLQRGGVRPQRLIIYSLEQIGSAPPKFLLTVNNENLIHPSLAKFLQNRLREHFDLIGTPIVFDYRAKEKTPSAKNK
jgi:GTP-binding protein